MIQDTFEKLAECLCNSKAEAVYRHSEVHPLFHELLKPYVVYPATAYDEEFGDVLWWNFPVCEPPHLGSPCDTQWPGDKWTHFSLMPVVWDGAGMPLYHREDIRK